MTTGTVEDAGRRAPTTAWGWWRTPQVTDIMTRTVVSAKQDTPLPTLVDEMVRHGISGIPVVDDESRLVGIVTEADVISKLAFGGTERRPMAVIGDLMRGHDRRWRSKSVGLIAGQIMTKNVETVRPSTTVQAAAQRMVEAGVKRLPVVDDDDRLVGIVSRADVLTSMHRSDDELQAEIAAALDDPARAPEEVRVEVSVADGVVTLRGTVQFPFDLPVLSAIVWRFPGVVDVRNEAMPRQPNPQPAPLRGDDHDYLRYLR